MKLKGIFTFDASVDTDHVIDAIHDAGFGVTVDDLTYEDYWARIEDSNGTLQQFEVDVPEEDSDAFKAALNQFPNTFIAQS